VHDSGGMIPETYCFCPRCACRVEIGRVALDEKLVCWSCGMEFFYARGQTRAAEQHKSNKPKPTEREKEKTIGPDWHWTPEHAGRPPRGLYLPDAFVFPFRADALWRTVSLVFGAAVLYGAVRLALWCYVSDGEQVDRFTRVLLWNGLLSALIVLTFGGLIVSYIAAAWGLTLLNETSHGADTVQHWPRLLLLEEFGATAYTIAAAVLAALPGVLTAELWHRWGISRPAAALMLMPALLPVFLLSMLELRSPLGAFSPRVWLSLLLDWWAWARFYFYSIVLFAAATGIATAARRGGWRLEAPAIGATAAVVWLIYCRLLGRLAWHCSGRRARTQSVKD
jgi:hypothetical protein